MNNLEPVPLRQWFTARRTKTAARVCKGTLLLLLTILSIAPALPAHPSVPSLASSEGTLGNCPTITPNATLALINATSVECPGPTGRVDEATRAGFASAGHIPDLSMPNPILSTIDDMIGAGGVIPTSPTNVTIYNSRVIMRLIGGSVPHDELLAPLDRVLSSFSSWGVEVSVANTWIPLIPYSSTLDVLGTNSSGSFVVRNTELDNGNYSGVLHVVYKATSQGELKWDLEFTPATSGRYRLAYDFHDLESTASLSAPLKKFDMRFGASNYTISWNDVPESLNVTTSLTPGQFTLFIDLRNISGGLTTRVDPGVVDTSYSSNSISYTFQRHVFFEPKASYFWAFYYDGQYIRYKYSPDGRAWYPNNAYSMPNWWPSLPNGNFSLPGVFASGQTVILAVGSQYPDTNLSNGVFIPTAAISPIIGSINGQSITWQPMNTIYIDPLNPPPCAPAPGCTVSVGIRDVNVALIPNPAGEATRPLA